MARSSPERGIGENETEQDGDGLSNGVLPDAKNDEHCQNESNKATELAIAKCEIGPAQTDDYLLTTLDEMEKRTDKLREMVKEAEIERMSLLGTLDMLNQSQALCNIPEGERDEVELYIDRLTSRLLTVDISVQIVRSPEQEESLKAVGTFLDKLQDEIRRDGTQKEPIQRYLNSCMEETNGPIDERFQGALLGCAAEDQKEVKKQLISLLKDGQD